MTTRKQSIADQLVAAARDLSLTMTELRFGPPVSFVYNPLDYAWAPHEQYLRRYGNSRKRVVFLGMNPGPFGMAQNGVPFGDGGMARGWLAIDAPIGRPGREHPKRPIAGFDLARGEVSGQRLWGAVADHFGAPARFFEKHFVANYCPLCFLEQSGRNRTPDRLASDERAALYAVCDRHLRRVVDALRPEWVIGIGRFAEQRARAALDGVEVEIAGVLHPSPASPAANRGWADTVRRQLAALGLCS
ncbi:MAG: single-stranded DNA-binding protein [Deltaproteobacteria bacterium]|nr:single-stranded DNA-binding protein [Deltaproteobacteria bacterium]